MCCTLVVTVVRLSVVNYLLCIGHRFRKRFVYCRSVVAFVFRRIRDVRAPAIDEASPVHSVRFVRAAGRSAYTFLPVFVSLWPSNYCTLVEHRTNGVLVYNKSSYKHRVFHGSVDIIRTRNNARFELAKTRLSR